MWLTRSHGRKLKAGYRFIKNVLNHLKRNAITYMARKGRLKMKKIFGMLGHVFMFLFLLETVVISSSAVYTKYGWLGVILLLSIGLPILFPATVLLGWLFFPFRYMLWIYIFLGASLLFYSISERKTATHNTDS